VAKVTTSAVQLTLGAILLPGYLLFYLWELLMLPTMQAFQVSIDAIADATRGPVDEPEA
jgi:hypothetical protein